MLYLMAEFIVGGRQYIYRSPIMVSVGQYVLVNVFGEVKAVRVVSVSQTNDTDYDGEIKPIVGVGYMLEDLDQPVKKQTRPKRRSIMQMLYRDRADYDPPAPDHWGDDR